MTVGRSILELRLAAVVWLRLATVVLGMSAPLLVFMPDTPFFILAAISPLVLFHRLIVRGDPPRLTRGYAIVVAYGPVLLLAGAALLGPPFNASALLLGILAYEVLAFLTAKIYLWLCPVGDRLFGPREAPRLARRWAAALILVVLVPLYVPYAVRTSFEDNCIDAGGAVLGWTCEYGP